MYWNNYWNCGIGLVLEKFFYDLVNLWFWIIDHFKNLFISKFKLSINLKKMIFVFHLLIDFHHPLRQNKQHIIKNFSNPSKTPKP